MPGDVSPEGQYQNAITEHVLNAIMEASEQHVGLGPVDLSVVLAGAVQAMAIVAYQTGHFGTLKVRKALGETCGKALAAALKDFADREQAGLPLPWSLEDIGGIH